MKTISMCAVLSLLVATAAEATTITATYTGGLGSSIERNILTGPGAPQLNTTLAVDRFDMQLNSGGVQLAGGGTADFYAWCIEPRELISLNSPITYQLVPLSQAVTNLGGMGQAKAAQVRELFGRFLPDFTTAISATQAGAIQVALWEIVRETPGNPLNLANGNIYFNRNSNAAVYDLAASYVGAIDGTGPRAHRLYGLANGTLGVQGSGAQDLVVQSNVPEPQGWAMFIAGFGLLGGMARRRRRLAAA